MRLGKVSLGDCSGWRNKLAASPEKTAPRVKQFPQLPATELFKSLLVGYAQFLAELTNPNFTIPSIRLIFIATGHIWQKFY
jgi:hypothetical protein